MSTATVQLDAGGLLPAKSKVDSETTEQIVARTYRHPALGDRPVIRLASDRLGQAEDLAMEFLGFEAPAVSATVAVQQRRSLGFAAWALINDPKNARYALDLVKRGKASARKARSKPGHAWEEYTEMAKDLGRSAPHFLPPFWEEVGRTFKDLGNPTYAGRALNKSLEAERVHALESDRARRRDVVLEFVLSGCLAGNALSEYGNDLQSQYSPAEAFSIFRDLCTRRTRGGIAPWASMPKDFTRLAKAADLNGDQELEKWLEDVIESPAMGRPPLQFWKSCSSHCKRIVSRNGAFAIALLRHTRPEPRDYGESKLGPWFELLEEWGVVDFLWEDEHQGAPPLGEPMAQWFGRIVRDEVPAPKRTLEMLERLAPRLKKEGAPLPLSVAHRFHATAIDIDVLEACLKLGIKVDDPPPDIELTFNGWLAANVDHPLRNQDIVESPKDERYRAAIFKGLNQALTCRGGTFQRGYRQTKIEQQAFPLAAAERPGITELWRQQTAESIGRLEEAGLMSFDMARRQLEPTLWPDTIRLFLDLAERLNDIEPVAMLQRTLQAGVFDEYGLPAFEKAVEQIDVQIQSSHRSRNHYLTFPHIVLTDNVHAYVISGDGTVKKHELRLPKKCDVTGIVVVGDDLAVSYRDDKYAGHFHWLSDPAKTYDAPSYISRDAAYQMATVLKDGSVFLGQRAVRSGDKDLPDSQRYLHDGERFWRLKNEWDLESRQHRFKVDEVDPQTGKELRKSIPPWFEEADDGTVEWGTAELMPAPASAHESPLGSKEGMLGWKTVKRRHGGYHGQGIDGRRWDKQDISGAVPVALLNQPGTSAYLPVTTTTGDRSSVYWLWDPSGSTVIACLQNYATSYAQGQVTVLPLKFWHFLKVRDEASSKKLRAIRREDCELLFKMAAADREQHAGAVRRGDKEPPQNPLVNLLPAVKKLLPTAPPRLLTGVARIVEQAERESVAFTTFRDRANADSKTETTSSAIVVNRKSDLGAAQWGLHKFQSYRHEGDISVSANLAATAAFLKGETKAGDLPNTEYLWFEMLDDLPLRCWQTFWRAAAAKMNEKDTSDVPWLEFLKLWHGLGIAELPGRFDLMEGYPEGAKKRSWGGYEVEVTAGKAFSMQIGDDLFVVVENEHHYQGRLPFQFLRYSTAKKPGNPPGYKVENIRKITSKTDPAQIAAFREAAESYTALPLPSKAELAEVAKNVAASPAEIGLIWISGLNIDSYQSNFLPAELRTALGCKTTEASAARQAIRNLNATVVQQLYRSVVAEGLMAPFATDRGPVLRSIEAVWQDQMPKRFQLDAALQKRLSALSKLSRWQRLDHEELLAIAADPAKHPLLQPREIEIKLGKVREQNTFELAAKNKGEQVIQGGSLRSILQLVGLVHAETPAGHPARPEIAALIKQTTKLLDHSGTLLELRRVHLYQVGKKKPPTPIEWLNTNVGKTKANAKEGTAHVDDGLIAAAAFESQNQAYLAFRPAKLKDDADLARLVGMMGIDVGQTYEMNNDVIPVVAAIKSPGFQKLAKTISGKDVPKGEWHQNPLHTAAPVVAAIRNKHKLGDDAAVLYAQLLAVPDPTTANVCTWNGWTTAQFKKASAELVGRKLVLEATRARAGRSIFLPGEWSDLKAPWLPIETWKMAHLVEYELDPRDPCPVGGPMVLRPFGELFAAAWQRVLDGDVPRYEEVKRKKKSK